MSVEVGIVHHQRELIGYGLGSAASAWLIVGSAVHLIPLDLTEVLGFISGGLCVWLTVKENIWNWPIGIANSVFFLVLFLQSRLFADMALQAIYIVLGFLGWYWWLRGGEHETALHVSRTGPAGAVMLATLTVSGAWLATLLLQGIGDSAPFWDGLTTVLSLVAQYMLTRKLFENWSIWIAADIIYVGLYAYKHLLLTALLYAVYAAMCVAGHGRWRRSLSAGTLYTVPSPIEEGRVHV